MFVFYRPGECWAGASRESLAGREQRCLQDKRMCPWWPGAGFCWLFPGIINNGVKIISGLRGWEWYYYGHSRSISFHLNSTIVFLCERRGLPISDQLAVVTYQAVNVRKHKQSYSSHEGGDPHRLQKEERGNMVIIALWCRPEIWPRWA